MRSRYQPVEVVITVNGKVAFSRIYRNGEHQGKYWEWLFPPAEAIRKTGRAMRRAARA